MVLTAHEGIKCRFLAGSSQKHPPERESEIIYSDGFGVGRFEGGGFRLGDGGTFFLGGGDFVFCRGIHFNWAT